MRSGSIDDGMLIYTARTVCYWGELRAISSLFGMRPPRLTVIEALEAQRRTSSGATQRPETNRHTDDLEWRRRRGGGAVTAGTTIDVHREVVQSPPGSVNGLRPYRVMPRRRSDMPRRSGCATAACVKRRSQALALNRLRAMSAAPGRAERLLSRREPGLPR